MKTKQTNGQRSKLWPRIKKAIMKYPDQFEMTNWFSRRGLQGTYLNNREIGRCGTAACVAGWALHVANTNRNNQSIRETRDKLSLRIRWYEEEATRVLGLTYDQASRLFYAGQWPREFAIRYDNATTPKARAKAAVDRINHFIKTGE